MISVEFKVPADEKDIWVAELWQAGSAGITEADVEGDQQWVRAFFQNGVDLEPLLARLSELNPRVREQADRDWVALSRENWEPLLVGERFFLVPDWRDDPTPEGRLRIEVNPGLACGTGAHEATRLCLRAIEDRMVPGSRVLDIGTGTGILSVAAALIGSGKVAACDSDPVAADIAAVNFRKAGISGAVFQGSVDAVASGLVDLAVCNISAETAAELAAEILRVLTPGGVAVASGFEVADAERVETAIKAAGGVIIGREREGDWGVLFYAAASGGAGKGPRTSSSRDATSSSSSSS